MKIVGLTFFLNFLKIEMDKRSLPRLLGMHATDQYT